LVSTIHKTTNRVHTLAEQSSGEITAFTNDRIAGKLMAMGVLPGSHIKLMRRAPFGGGWYVKVDDMLLALREEEVNSIEVK